MNMTDVVIDLKKYSLTESQSNLFAEEYYGKPLIEIGTGSNVKTYTFEDGKHAKQFEEILNSTFLLREKPSK